MRENPVLGQNLPFERRCTRMKPGGPCLQPGTTHIIWEGNFSSVSCDNCAEFARLNRVYQQAHAFVAGCIDPKALWYRTEETCRLARTPEDVAAGSIVFDQ